MRVAALPEECRVKVTLANREFIINVATESRETGDRITKENLSNDDAVGSVRVDRSEPADGGSGRSC